MLLALDYLKKLQQIANFSKKKKNVKIRFYNSRKK
jgi:hypothetical protein